MNALRASVLLILVGGLWLALAGLSAAPVSIKVEGPRYQFEPATVRLRIRVERDPANQALTVALVSDGFERSSLEELQGEKAALVRWIEYRDIPSGEYTVIAVVHRPQDRPVRAVDKLTVLGRY